MLHLPLRLDTYSTIRTLACICTVHQPPPPHGNPPVLDTLSPGAYNLHIRFLKRKRHTAPPPPPPSCSTPPQAPVPRRSPHPTIRTVFSYSIGLVVPARVYTVVSVMAPRRRGTRDARVASSPPPFPDLCSSSFRNEQQLCSLSAWITYKTDLAASGSAGPEHNLPIQWPAHPVGATDANHAQIAKLKIHQ